MKFSVSIKNFQNDMLWRLWISDSSYLKHNNLGIFVSKEDAGDCSAIVYGTATTINGEADPRILANVTWLFDVDLEFEYLVRFYFCDIVSPTPRKLFFNIYINALAVVSDFDLNGKNIKHLGCALFHGCHHEDEQNPSAECKHWPINSGFPGSAL